MAGRGQDKEKSMHHYEYVKKSEWKPARDEFEKIIKEVQNELRNDLSFQFVIVGSGKRNMVTCDPNTTEGFDFDYDLILNHDEYGPCELKDKFFMAFQKAVSTRGYKCEKSTRVITIKKAVCSAFGQMTVPNKPGIHAVNVFEQFFKQGDSFHSCDLAIVRVMKGKREYIHFDKQPNHCMWEERPEERDLDNKVKWIKGNRLWSEVRKRYLEKKNENTDKNKHSRSIYAETINEIYCRNKTHR